MILPTRSSRVVAEDNNYMKKIWNGLPGMAPVRLGFLTESLEYTRQEYESNAALHYARQAVATTSRYMTHIMTPDEKDVPFIQSLCAIPVAWFVCPIPERFICKEHRGTSLSEADL